jgi:hypothetical protein
MARSSFMAVLLAVSVLVAGGCDSTVSPIQVAPGCPEQPMRRPEAWAATPATQLLDDFDTGDGKIAKVEGRDGAWLLLQDLDAAPSTAGSDSRCVARGPSAGHFVASDSTDWGAMWTASFRALAGGGAQPYDGSKYGGLSFWAGFDAANGAAFPIRVGMLHMDTAWNGGVCSTYCMDFHGIDVVPGVAWQRIEFRFADLKQQSWGDVQGPLKSDQLVGFVVWPNRKADLWIDDLRFEP